MKRNSLSILSGLLAATIFIAGCSKSNSNGGGSAGMSATISGTAWASNFPVVAAYTAAANSFYITGFQFKSSDTTLFQILFNGPVAVNQTISTDSVDLDILYNDSKAQLAYESSYGIGHAVLKITSYDAGAHTINATFSGVLISDFNSSDSIVITNGKFSTTYKQQ